LKVGSVYIAPPDHHLVILDGKVGLSNGPRENRHRPSIDTLFRSAAAAGGPRTVGVVLSGSLHDGAAGLAAIVEAGGKAFIQDPREAAYSGMPLAAMAAVPNAPVLALHDMVTELRALISAPPSAHRVAVMGNEMGRPLQDNPISPFTCPDCHGTLWEINEGDDLRYECRVGHSFSSAALLEALGDEVENALWQAVKTLQERADLSERLGARLKGTGAARSREYFDKSATAARRHSDLIREALLDNGTITIPVPPGMEGLSER
jgi:two-component system chemotaxis response regulator CheB